MASAGDDDVTSFCVSDIVALLGFLLFEALPSSFVARERGVCLNVFVFPTVQH
jgi:hypothetical protein